MVSDVPSFISNLTFEIDGTTIPPQRILQLLHSLVLDQYKASKDRRTLEEKLKEAQFSEREYFELCTQENFSKVFMRFAYHKLLSPRIPALLDSMAQSIEAGKDSQMKYIVQLISSQHPEFNPAPQIVEKHDHLHLESMTPQQLMQDYDRLNDQVKQLTSKIKK